MSNLFLVLFSNGNGDSFKLLMKGSKQPYCTEQFRTKKMDAMAQHLGENFLPDVQEDLVETKQLPCQSCVRRKSCDKAKSLSVIPDQDIKEIIALVKEEEREIIKDFIDFN